MKPTRRQVLKMIAEDTEQDAKNFDGKPFTGSVVAEYLGYLGASVAALAKIMESLLPEDED